MIKVTQRGSFDRTEKYLRRLQEPKRFEILNKYGAIGVNALRNATPVDSGETANSWYYVIEQKKGYYSLRWANRHMENGIPIAILIQYGHGTRNGGYVQGRDFINPVIRPIFDQIADEAWKEVTRV